MKKFPLLFSVATTSIMVAFGFLDPVFAAELKNPLGATTIPGLVNIVLKGVLGLVGSLALLMFVYGGFLWLTAMGEDKRVKQGWDTMTWAALGIAVIFASYAIVTLIFKSLGVN